MTAESTSLAVTLRVWRDRLSPAEAGRVTGPWRRAVGWRREELAELAGVSVDDIVRLEQGRATTPPAQVVAALARALRLTRAERDNLDVLAGQDRAYPLTACGEVAGEPLGSPSCASSSFQHIAAARFSAYA